jgi:hypothetical protein
MSRNRHQATLMRQIPNSHAAEKRIFDARELVAQ